MARHVSYRIEAFCAAALLAVPVWASTEVDASLYGRACAACHGNDGRGRLPDEVGFDMPLPDFSDCAFASREPDADWFAVIHEGGRVRAFDRMMPAFGDALSADEIQAVLRHVRTFCTDRDWPRGEFNVPRPIFTEKAFPEDEIVVTAAFDSGSGTAGEIEILYEKRIGPRGMVELALPFAYGRDSTNGIGDVALGYKHTVHHDLESGAIVAAGAEVVLPTGDDDGLGQGSTVVEPFVTYGRLLPGDTFVQAEALAEIALGGNTTDEAVLRLAAGKTWTEGPYGRAWTPIAEMLVARNLNGDDRTRIDFVPQVQVSLNTRQHVLLNIGVRIPVDDADGDPQFVVYLLWDWFDGGFFDGWGR